MVLLLLRVLLFTVVFVFGYDIWILPYLFDDDKTFRESLSPLIGYCPRKDDLAVKLFRLSLALAFVATFYLFYMHPYWAVSVYEYCYYLVDLLIKWGNNKLANVT